MTGRRHRSNCELVAQGVANIGSALFGGICVTGTIARTATNVRAGARGPRRRHAAFGVPAAVHADRGAARELHPARGARRRAGRGRLEHGGEARIRDAAALVVGRCRRAARDLPADDLPRSHRRHPGRLRARRGAVHQPHGGDDRHRGATRRWWPTTAPTTAMASACPTIPRSRPIRDVLVYRITGAFFFGAASTIGGVLDGIADQRKAFVVDFAAVPFLDSTAANAHRPRRRQGAPPGHPAVHHRRVARGAPRAADPWRHAAARAAIARRSRVRSPTSRAARRGPRPMTRPRPDGSTLLKPADLIDTVATSRRWCMGHARIRVAILRWPARSACWRAMSTASASCISAACSSRS